MSETSRRALETMKSSTEDVPGGGRGGLTAHRYSGRGEANYSVPFGAQDMK